MGLLLLILFILIVIIVLILSNVVIVPQGEAYVLERLGKYSQTWGAGLHVKTPFIERIVNKVNLKEQVLDFPPQPVITKDNVTIQIDSVIFARVFDPKLYTYGIDNPIAGLQNLTATTLRSVIGEMELDQTLTSREEINASMLKSLDVATDPWGLRLVRVEVKNIQPPREIEEVMTKQMRAERDRRQTVLEATAHKEAVVARAEGDKQAKKLAAEAERDAQIALAEGKAKSVQMVYEAEAKGLESLKNANVSQSVLQLKGIEALKDISNGRATKIFMPTDLTQAVSSLGIVAEATGIGDATPIDKTPAPRIVAQPDPCIDKETGAGGKEAAYTTQNINADIANANIEVEDEE